MNKKNTKKHEQNVIICNNVIMNQKKDLPALTENGAASNAMVLYVLIWFSYELSLRLDSPKTQRIVNGRIRAN